MNNNDTKQKLAELEKQSEALTAEIAKMREQLDNPAPWEPEIGDEVLTRIGDGSIDVRQYGGQYREYMRLCHARGRVYPNTPAGREQAELDDRKELFRARWKRAADVAPNDSGWQPCFSRVGRIEVRLIVYDGYGVWKFSTEEKCRAWIDSEGEDVVREMLNGGLW